ncbi:MAG: hypothetical protein HSCHL_0034 [Hydrogenibacillus schlegelii]|uniref:Uncharacterized protein n=1 Tax=Hydrogenibacillus schlegelii TaxID=1484 RepID=A0A2T5G9B8_HYDSH|nr:MAG: hypothetical protein HSCHL_0034 [Hydrogenibacillus schlegelii]
MLPRRPRPPPSVQDQTERGHWPKPGGERGPALDGAAERLF